MMRDMYWFWGGLIVGSIATHFAQWLSGKLFTPLPEAKSRR